MPTPKTGFSTVGERVNQRGARLTCSLLRASQVTKYPMTTTFARPVASAAPATPQCSTRMNRTSNTTFATVEAMSPIITWRAAPSARTSCSRQNAAASTGTKASITATK